MSVVVCVERSERSESSECTSGLSIERRASSIIFSYPGHSTPRPAAFFFDSPFSCSLWALRMAFFGVARGLAWGFA